MTFFFVAYGAGQVVNGIFCRHYPARYVFPLALSGSAAINVVMFVFIKAGYIADNYGWTAAIVSVLLIVLLAIAVSSTLLTILKHKQ